jgi:hypothetical protein
VPGADDRLVAAEARDVAGDDDVLELGGDRDVELAGLGVFDGAEVDDGVGRAAREVPEDADLEQRAVLAPGAASRLDPFAAGERGAQRSGTCSPVMAGDSSALTWRQL